MSIKLSGTQDADPYRGEKEGRLREVGNQAVWSLSSCKPGIIQIKIIDMSLRDLTYKMILSHMVDEIKTMYSVVPILIDRFHLAIITMVYYILQY